MYIIAVTYEGRKGTFRYVSSGQESSEFIGYPNKSKKSTAMITANALSGPFIDSLVITADGHEVQYYPLESYLEEGIEITLEVTELSTVSFESSEGSKVEAKTVTRGQSISQPNKPLRGGFDFAGWYRDALMENEWDFENNVVVSDTTLYAKWTWVGPDLVDRDGNSYSTVQIGNQVWIVENFRTTKYSCGTPIPHVTDNTA